MTEIDAQSRAAQFAEAIPRLANADDDLMRRGQWFSGDWRLVVGAADYHVGVERGRITAFERGPFFMRAASFSLTADASDWLAFWEPVPAPGAHDILAMSKCGRLVLAGDLTPLMRNLQVVKDMLAAPRQLHSGPEVAA
ncbi:MAG: hypothetical protein AAFR23_09480 [Pseudomonadota bacterium]